MEDRAIEETGILLGLAEVKVPLKAMTIDERVNMTHICYRKLLELEPPAEYTKESNLKCIGVVDSFYALQEVTLCLSGDQVCSLLRKEEIVLRFKVEDVITAVLSLDSPSRLIVLSWTQNFGKTLFVLELPKAEIANCIAELLFTTVAVAQGRRCSVIGKAASTLKQVNGTISKAMGQKVNNLLAKLNYNNQTKDSSTSECALPITDNCQVDAYDYEEDSENESDVGNDLLDGTTSQPLDSSLLKVRKGDKPMFFKSDMTPVEAEIEYLLSSEETFVNSLENLIVIKDSLKKERKIPQDDIGKITKYIDELHFFHKNFLHQLKLNKGSVKDIGNLFIGNFSHFHKHVQYIRNVPVVDKLYNSYSEILKKSYPSMIEFIRKPRMRINIYILTFEGLKRYCDTDEVDFVNNIIASFKTYLKEADTRLIIDSINMCPFNLMNYGYLIMDGELSLKKGDGLVKRRYHILLLESLLVISKGRTDMDEYVASFNLCNLKLLHVMRGVMIHLSVQYNKTPLLIFKAKSVKMQQKWIENLRMHIDKASNSFFNSDSEHNAKLNGISKRKSSKSAPPLCVSKKLSRSVKHFSNSLPRANIEINDLQESEKLLIRNIEHALSKQFETSFKEYFEDIKNLYDFHLRHIHSAVHFKSENFLEFVLNHLLSKRSEFEKVSSKILFLGALSKYDGSRNLYLQTILDVAIDNFFMYMRYIEDLQGKTKEQIEKLRKCVESFNNCLDSASQKLKQKYIPKLSTSTTEIVQEGVLLIADQLGDNEIETYCILTTKNLYFLRFFNMKYIIHDCFDVADLRIGNPTGIKSFQIKVAIDLYRSRKFNVRTLDIVEKNHWLSSLCKTLPQDSDRRGSVKTVTIETTLLTSLIEHKKGKKKFTKVLFKGKMKEALHDSLLEKTIFESDL